MKISSLNEISAVLSASRDQGIIHTDDTTIICVDLAIVDERLDRLIRCFPDETLHAIPIKTNPLAYILKHIVSRGMGLEAASMGEVFLAVNAGIDTSKIVFDSPAKTPGEISQMREMCCGARLNADSIEELELYPRSNSGFKLGLRINPLVDSLSVASMNVATDSSKFGVPLTRHEDILAACCYWDDLDCLHIHIGSQVPSIGPMIDAIQKVLLLAEQINDRAGYGKIAYLDIGGGFPVNYESNEPYLIEDYVAALEERCPEIFSGDYRLITEFGRYVYANSAWVTTKVEYVKSTAIAQTLITHAGADLFLRECYNPEDWYHNITILDHEYNKKSGTGKPTSIAGPLCFGGDFLSRGKMLPLTDKNDNVIVHDTGANTFALWSRHCSRPFPKVLAYNSEIAGLDIHIAKHRETYDEILNFWS